MVNLGKISFCCLLVDKINIFYCFLYLLIAYQAHGFISLFREILFATIFLIILLVNIRPILKSLGNTYTCFKEKISTVRISCIIYRVCGKLNPRNEHTEPMQLCDVHADVAAFIAKHCR